MASLCLPWPASLRLCGVSFDTQYRLRAWHSGSRRNTTSRWRRGTRPRPLRGFDFRSAGRLLEDRHRSRASAGQCHQIVCRQRHRPTDAHDVHLPLRRALASYFKLTHYPQSHRLQIIEREGWVSLFAVRGRRVDVPVRGRRVGVPVRGPDTTRSRTHG